MPRRGDNIRKRKDGRWEGRYRNKIDCSGKTKYKSVYGKTYKEVKEKLALALANSNKDSNNQDNSYISFSKVLEIWVENNKVRQKAATINRYKNLIDTHIIPELGNYDVKDITASVVNSFLARKLKSGRIDGNGGLSNSYVKSIMLIIKSALKFASDEGMCAPLKSPIFKPNIETRDLCILNYDEQKILENYLLKNTNETTVGVLLSLHTGLRIGEVCALTWNDIDLNNRIIHVRHTISRIRESNIESKNQTKLILDSPKTKTSKRDIPLSTFLFDVLQTVKRMAKSVFVVSNKPSFVSPRTYEYRYHKILKNCNVSAINFHALRHTFATRCIESGVDVKSLSEILGHSNVSITLNTYVHSSMEFKRIQIEKVSVLSA